MCGKLFSIHLTEMLDGLILREPRKCQNSINTNYHYDKVKAALKKKCNSTCKRNVL